MSKCERETVGVCDSLKGENLNLSRHLSRQNVSTAVKEHDGERSAGQSVRLLVKVY